MHAPEKIIQCSNGARPDHMSARSPMPASRSVKTPVFPSKICVLRIVVALEYLAGRKRDLLLDAIRRVQDWAGSERH
jgi:hypothetical protein